MASGTENNIKSAAANADAFMPDEFSEPEFVTWAGRVSLKALNTPVGATEAILRIAVLSEGIPTPEWAQAFRFLAAIASKRRDGLK